MRSASSLTGNLLQLAENSYFVQVTKPFVACPECEPSVNLFKVSLL